jgi:pimeloyl-ACP methyl ester carboxylesterase
MNQPIRPRARTLIGPEPSEVLSKYIRQSPSANTVIVFVHGWMGDGVSTWTNPDTGAYWPAMLAHDNTFDGDDIFVYSYSTGSDSHLSIDELAESMRSVLTANEVSNYARIIFLSHSMGGLVTRAYLLKNREVARHTAFAYFFSTPTTGSQVAQLAGMFLGGSQLSKLAPMTSDAYIADLLRQWLAANFLFPSFCAYEKRPTHGVTIVVNIDSAVSLCTKAVDPIDTDHIDIVKPSTPNAASYIAFKAAYAEATIPGLRTELDERDRRRKQRAELGSLLLEGQLLLTHIVPGAPLPGLEADAWANKAEAYFHKEMDDSYIARFRDSSGLPPIGPVGQYSDAQRNLWSAIFDRSTRLEEFMKELVN